MFCGQGQAQIETFYGYPVTARARPGTAKHKAGTTRDRAETTRDKGHNL